MSSTATSTNTAASVNASSLRLDRTFAAQREQYLAAVEEVLASGRVVGGPEVERFEASIAHRTGRRHAIAVTSGTDAMLVLLAALGIDRQWAVQVPAYSFLATASPLLARGVNPVFVDVDPHYHLDLGCAGSCLPRVGKRALIVAGLFGDSLDYAAVEAFCERHQLLLIEDAAQSFGASWLGRPGGSLGVASTLSFAPTKTLPCFGNMGAVVTDDDSLAERVRWVRYHGKPDSGSPSRVQGFNAMPSAVGAAMLNVSLTRHDAWQARREAIAKRYCAQLAGTSGLGLPLLRPGACHNWHKFVVRHEQRDGLARHLSSSGVDTQVHYPLALPDEPIFAASPVTTVARARHLARVSLTLPLHAQMHDDEVDQVIRALRSFRTAETELHSD